MAEESSTQQAGAGNGGQDEDKKNLDAQGEGGDKEKVDDGKDDGLLTVLLEDVGVHVEHKPADEGEGDKGDEGDDDDKGDEDGEGGGGGEGDEGGDTGGGDEGDDDDKGEGGEEGEDGVKVTKGKPLADVVQAQVDATLEKIEERREAKKRAAQQAAKDAKAAEEEEARRKEAADSEPPFDGWEPEEIEEYELAKFAEGHDPRKYKGMAKRVVEFREKVDAYITEHEGDEERTFDEQDEEFQQFVTKNRPKYSGRDRFELRREMTAQDIAARVERVQGERFEKIERTQRMDAARPVVKEQLGVFQNVLGGLLEKEEDLGPVLESIKDQNQDPITQLAVEEIVRATAVANAYLEVNTGLTEADAANENQVAAITLIRRESEWFAKNGGDQRTKVVDGVEKTFLTPAQWVKLKAENPNRLADHWTLDRGQTLSLIAADATKTIKARTTGFLKAMKDAGWEPPKPAKDDEKAAKKADKKDEGKGQAPKKENAGSEKPKKKEPAKSPVIGGRGDASAGTGGKTVIEGAMSKDEMSALGLPTVIG
jgi:hypothetical protein